RKVAIKRLITAITSLKKKDLLRLLKYVNEYPPRTRAFLGALLEKINMDLDLDFLKQSLNPLTEYKLGIIPDILSTAEKWNIK
ncbi:MAG: hypothetical protein KKE61_01605, partial [Proteobacteria bacterium]|nr:hypothetical protein [Pseudomonadota bacterium]